MESVYQIVNSPVTAHAFNATRTKVALCPDTSDIHIYEKKADKWVLVNTLTQHDKLVTCIDWAPKSDKLITCSQDRNAYVWVPLENNEWKPTLVLLRINRAATYVRWSPKEDKFAVASGARCISVCYFEAENDWYVSKHIKKPIRSTVTSLDWHQNNVLLVAGCTDRTARVFSAYIKGVDVKPEKSVWGEKLPFNTLCAEVKTPCVGWVHDCAFSPDGNAIAFVGHDSTLNVFYPGENKQCGIKTKVLPFSCLIWLTDENIVAAGQDCVPYLFTKRNGEWYIVDKLEGKRVAGPVATGNVAANRFRQMDTFGQKAGDNKNENDNVHQNTITCIRSYQSSSIYF
eukprot:NODE_319_length_9908_cov_1.288001.p5 type:complete len:343 gc:universal NODE_319_length_9908_cov_1.288001:1396-2424(+)